MIGYGSVDAYIIHVPPSSVKTGNGFLAVMDDSPQDIEKKTKKIDHPLQQ